MHGAGCASAEGAAYSSAPGAGGQEAGMWARGRPIASGRGSHLTLGVRLRSGGDNRGNITPTGVETTEAENYGGAGQQRSYIFWIWGSFLLGDKSRIIAVILQSDKELWYKNLLKLYKPYSCPPVDGL